MDDVRRFREKHGLRQVDLAELLGLGSDENAARTIRRWEQGTTEPAPYLELALREISRTLKTQRRKRVTEGRNA